MALRSSSSKSDASRGRLLKPVGNQDPNIDDAVFFEAAESNGNDFENEDKVEDVLAAPPGNSEHAPPRALPVKPDDFEEERHEDVVQRPQSNDHTIVGRLR